MRLEPFIAIDKAQKRTSMKPFVQILLVKIPISNHSLSLSNGAQLASYFFHIERWIKLQETLRAASAPAASCH